MQPSVFGERLLDAVASAEAYDVDAEALEECGELQRIKEAKDLKDRRAKKELDGKANALLETLDEEYGRLDTDEPSQGPSSMLADDGTLEFSRNDSFAA